MFKTPLKGGCRHSSVGLPLFESACPRELQWIDLIHRGSSKLELHLSTPKSKHYCGLGTSARSKSCNIIIMRNKISALGFTGSHFLSNIPILSGLLDEFLSSADDRCSNQLPGKVQKVNRWIKKQGPLWNNQVRTNNEWEKSFKKSSDIRSERLVYARNIKQDFPSCAYMSVSDRNRNRCSVLAIRSNTGSTPKITKR